MSSRQEEKERRRKERLEREQAEAKRAARRKRMTLAFGGVLGVALIAGIARQPEAQGRLFTPFLITVGLVEAAYFINLAFMALFVFATPGAS